MMIKQTENEVKSAVKKYLEVNGYTVYSINNAGMNVAKKGDRPLWFAGMVALKPGCRIVFVDTKSKVKKPTDDKDLFLNLVNHCNDIGIWADSLDMFVEKFDKQILIYEI